MRRRNEPPGMASAGRAGRTHPGTVVSVSRYTPPSDHDHEPPYRRRPLSIRIGVWVLLVGVLALVFVDVLAALL